MKLAALTEISLPKIFDRNHRKTQFAGGHGDFFCVDVGITKIMNCPKNLTGDFMCFKNKLKSLEGGPVFVGGEYNVSNNKLESLEHCAETIGHALNASNNKIKSLKDIHKTIKSIKRYLRHKFGCKPNRIAYSRIDANRWFEKCLFGQ